MKEGFIESQGVKIHFLEGTSKDPNQISILFVPGVMMPAWIWEKQLAYFSKNYHVVAMAPRSHGESEQCSDGHYAYSMAKDIQAVIETLNLDPLVLVGWSLGVPQVVNYAAHFGAKKLIGLVLVDGALGVNESMPFYHSMVDLWSGFQTDRLSNTKKFAEDIFKLPKEPSYLEKLTLAAMKMPTNTVMTLMYNYILQDFRPLLQNLNVPTWIATIDGPRKEYMENMQRMIKNSSLEVFAPAGHALFVDQPERFNRSLEAFIRSLNNTSFSDQTRKN